MFCTEENRKTCREEKLGCEGCFYNNNKNNKKPFYQRILEKFSKKGLEFVFELPTCRYYIPVAFIKIKDEFINTPPLERKMDRKWRYYRETGRLSSPIVLNEQFYLIDGYTSYLIAKADGLKTVEVEIRKEKQR